jgi:hypothetical protein
VLSMMSSEVAKSNPYPSPENVSVSTLKRKSSTTSVGASNLHPSKKIKLSSFQNPPPPINPSLANAPTFQPVVNQVLNLPPLPQHLKALTLKEIENYLPQVDQGEQFGFIIRKAARKVFEDLNQVLEL